jgi:hypothetical protein
VFQQVLCNALRISPIFRDLPGRHKEHVLVKKIKLSRVCVCVCGQLRDWQVTEIKEYGATLPPSSYKENIIFMYLIQLLLCVYVDGCVRACEA